MATPSLLVPGCPPLPPPGPLKYGLALAAPPSPARKTLPAQVTSTMPSMVASPAETSARPLVP